MKGKWLDTIRRRWRKPRRDDPADRILLALDGLVIGLERKLNNGPPHEVTIVVPRAEIRVVEQDGRREVQVVMNSITIAHSPRFPPSRADCLRKNPPELLNIP